jgi:hypothetical protein
MFYLARRMREVWVTSKMDPGHLLRQIFIGVWKTTHHVTRCGAETVILEPKHSFSDQKQSQQGSRKRQRPVDPGEADVGLREQALVGGGLQGGKRQQSSPGLL